MLIHREALGLARMTAADDEGGKFALSCLMIEADGHVVACDGVHLLRVHGHVDEPSLFDAIIPEDERKMAASLLLPREAAESFNAALKKRKRKKGEPAPHIVVSVGDSGIQLASADGKVTRRFDVTPPELPFPDYQHLMRPRTSVKAVTINVDVMLTVLRALKGAGCGSVTMTMAEGEGAPIRLDAFSDPMGPVQGLLMPMRADDAKDAAA